MDELISRSNAIKAFSGKPPEYYSTGYICDVLNELPAVDATPVVHGRWIDRGSLSCRCSCCGCKSNAEHNYCPFCGAKMDEEAR